MAQLSLRIYRYLADILGLSDQPQPMTTVPSRNWESLPRAALLEVISRVDDFTVLVSAQFVCTSWRSVCRDPRRWRTINLRAHHRKNLYSKFETLCAEALGRSSGQVADVTVDDFCDACILQLIVRSPNQIKRLSLWDSKDIGDKALCKAFEMLPSLEELEVSRGTFSPDFIPVLALRCPHLRSLTVRFRDFYTGPYHPTTFDRWPDNRRCNKYAEAIAGNLPGLQSLNVCGDTLTDAGVRAILDGCPNLESLDLRGCPNVELSGGLDTLCREKLRGFEYGELKDCKDERMEKELAGADMSLQCDFNPLFWD